jgi:hypothetical protein
MLMLGGNESPTASVEEFTVTLKSATFSESRMLMKPQGVVDFREKDTVCHLVFDVSARDPKTPWAFEIGQVFTAKSKAGETRNGMSDVRHFSSIERNMERSLGAPLGVRYPSRQRFAATEEGPTGLHAHVVFAGDQPVTEFAELTADLFAARLEVYDFTFSKDEFVINTVKHLGPARLKVVSFDPNKYRDRLEVKLDLPRRSRATMVHDRFSAMNDYRSVDLDIAVEGEGGALTWLKWSGTSSSGAEMPVPQHKERFQREYSGINWPKDFKAVHIVASRLAEYPRRHTFTLKNIKIMPAKEKPPQQGNPPVKVAPPNKLGLR